MSITKRLINNDSELEIIIHGRFDYSLHREFRACYQDQQPDLVYNINLSEAQYMDSSALGMMLLLKEHTEKSENGTVKISHPSNTVLKILKIAHFDKLIKIEN
ncbi:MULTISPECIES: STAS domain-containing protein [unclassified Motilimonas]|uniref:STAS domain-containing protein n=1 Tax=Motilimonas TaxID=1914248 RepID=UPI001E4D8BC4|nr:MULTISPECIES: STAS domain-containing protein [unclassified Motilimonas]MCE0558210.1 STAS domain-containing protein [Motilimonas sp. E26]MDO6526390.1 STAS domain-containing protein [Motilimonas sp. 1_MG-2023]